MQPLTAYPASSLQSRRHPSTSGRRNRMRVQIKGIHTTYKKLANGETKKYYYVGKVGRASMPSQARQNFLSFTARR